MLPTLLNLIFMFHFALSLFFMIHFHVCIHFGGFTLRMEACVNVASRMFHDPEANKETPRPPCYPSPHLLFPCPCLYRQLRLIKVSGGSRREQWSPTEIA